MKAIIPLASLILLAACGGGGSEPEAVSSSPAPIADSTSQTPPAAISPAPAPAPTPNPAPVTPAPNPPTETPSPVSPPPSAGSPTPAPQPSPQPAPSPVTSPNPGDTTTPTPQPPAASPAPSGIQFACYGVSTGAFTITVDIDQSRMPWNTLRTTGWDGFLDDPNGQSIATIFGEPSNSRNIVVLLNPGNEVTTAVQAWIGPPRGREELGTTYHFRSDGKLFMVTRLPDAESGFSGVQCR